MLSVWSVLAHQGRPAAPGELVETWSIDPLALAAVAATAVLYVRGRRPVTDTRARQLAFASGLLAVAVAVLSPLEAAAAALASAHMIQHVLLVLVAAPLLAWSAPTAALARGLPLVARRAAPVIRRRVGVGAGAVRALRSPIGRWLAYVAVLWIWHSSALYGAATEHAALHAVEHAMFLGASLAIWAVIAGPPRTRVPRGAGLLLVFGLALQTVFLSALLTFANDPWYPTYAATTSGWGLSPLADQQLAGVIMWVPAGLFHVCIAVALLATWIRESDPEGGRATGRLEEPARA